MTELSFDNAPVPQRSPLRSSMKKPISEVNSSSASDSPKHSRRVGKRASFSCLEIREYNVIVEDENPSNSLHGVGGELPTDKIPPSLAGLIGGPPLSLGWDYDEKNTQVLDVDHYEANRGQRKTQAELFMSNCVRRYMLLNPEGETQGSKVQKDATTDLKKDAKSAAGGPKRARKEKSKKTSILGSAGGMMRRLVKKDKSVGGRKILTQ